MLWSRIVNMRAEILISRLFVATVTIYNTVNFNAAQTQINTSIKITPEPLWPCYSIHYLEGNVTKRYRYVPSSQRRDTQCVFTLQGPRGSVLNLQLEDIVIQHLGIEDDNCDKGAVKLYNFHSGSLILADTVCRSMKMTPPIETEDNVAVLITNLQQGQFILEASVSNSTSNSTTETTTTAPGSTPRRKKTHKQNTTVSGRA